MMYKNLNDPFIVLLAVVATCFFSFGERIQAQTILKPGDLMVVGVNTNLSGCGASGGEDEISLVAFRDIAPGTEIHFTDNGWQRLNAGQWGNSEGFLVARRSATAPVIPAGTLIVFRFPSIPSADNPVNATLPDNNWEFESLGLNNINLAADGDQLYVMQGGIWDNGTATISNQEQDAQYIGGTILFGFNTKSAWEDFTDATSASGLHPDIASCYHVEPVAGDVRYFSYQGPEDAATQFEWIDRITAPLNWTVFSDCESYQQPNTTFALTPSDIGLNCTVCSGCGLVDEQLILSLPASGGPFNVEFYNGVDTLEIQNVSDGDVINASITQSTSFYLVSVSATDGCPVSSNLGAPVLVEVFKEPIANTPDPYRVCNENGMGTFVLSSLNESIRGGANGVAVRWYTDQALNTPIPEPANFMSGPATVYATTFNGNCESAPVAVELQLGTESNPLIVLTSPVSCNGASDASIEVQTSGEGLPYTYNWSDDSLDGQSSGSGLSAGVYEVSVTDVDGCEEVATIIITDPTPLDLSCGQSQAVSSVGGSDGIASINITGGTAPYTLDWSGPAAGMQSVTASGSTDISGLVAGTYTIILTDANGCSLDCIFTINDPSCTLSVIADVVQRPSCPDVNNGQIDLQISGGQSPYNIDWNADAYDQLESANDLGIGNYSVLVTDAQGCTNNVTVTLNALNTSPSVLIPEVGAICQNECYELILNYTGQGPFEMPIRIDAGKGEVSVTIQSDSNRDTFLICPSDFGIVNATNIQIFFDALFDQTTCPVSLNETRTLQVLPTDQGFLDTVLCQEDFLFYNGTIYDRNNPSGMEALDAQTVNGCDSIVNINLSFFPVAQKTIDTLLCVDETILVNGTLYGADRMSGTEVFPNASANGCDSLVFVDVEIDEPAATVISTTLCEGRSLEINGVLYDINNPSGSVVFPRAVGCDSTVFVNLNFIETKRDTIFYNLCPGASVDINGVTYSEQNPGGTERYIASTGCDSLVLIDLDFNFIRESFFDTTICEGDQVIIGNTIYDINNPSGREVFPVLNDQCDSFVNVSLNFLKAINVRLNGGGSVCPGDSINLVFRVTNTNAVDLELSDGRGNIIPLNNVTDGYVYRVSPAVSSSYSVISISGEDIGTGCPPTAEGVAIVDVRPITATGTVVSNFGDFDLSCPDSNDGAVSVEIDGGLPQYVVAWSTGMVGDTLSGLAAGSYEFTVTDANGCQAEGAVSLEAPESIALTTDVLSPVCAGESTGAIILRGITGGMPPYEYSTDGQTFRTLDQTTPIITDLASGTYSFSIQDVNDCSTVSVVTIPEPQALDVDLGPDVTIKYGDSLQLDPILNFLPDQFAWRPAETVSDPASLTPLVIPTETTTVVFTATDTAGCEVSDQLTITIDNSRNVFLPSAFSPNGDGLNDFFSPLVGENVRMILSLKIFDRWGTMMYDGNDLPGDNDSGWNGRINGELAPAGVYVFYAEIEFLDGVTEVYQGDMVLIR
jgi:gliding motility-associated-like protein